ncbi:MAG: glycosyltransferase [candidate division Zixibacteria bacterium]|nr:glycosyltransferase [candidate division Zixibacteria bacterium]
MGKTLMPGRVVIFGWANSVHIQRWATGLTERGFDIRLISLGGDPIEGVETINLPRTGLLSYFTQARRAVALAKEFGPDIIHVHYAGGFGYWGTRCGFAPLIVSVWGSDVVDLPRNLLFRYLIKRTLKRADRITATSDFLKRVSLELVPEIEDKIDVIPFGVTVPENPSPLSTGPVRLCFIKMHRRKYGPEILLKAFAHARSQIPDLCLTMAGEGEMTPELKNLSSQLGVADSVKFVGFVPNDQIYSLLQEHHIMVMPSVMESESFGVAVLEASACGRPVIASRVGGVPEVLRHGETGLLVPPGDVDALTEAIVALASDREKCRAMGEAGRELVQTNYIWERSLDLMSILYKRSIDGKQKNPPI